jgi:hypothetical protein
VGQSLLRRPAREFTLPERETRVNRLLRSIFDVDDGDRRVRPAPTLSGHFFKGTGQGRSPSRAGVLSLPRCAGPVQEPHGQRSALDSAHQDSLLPDFTAWVVRSSWSWQDQSRMSSGFFQRLETFFAIASLARYNLSPKSVFGGPAACMIGGCWRASTPGPGDYSTLNAVVAEVTLLVILRV